MFKILSVIIILSLLVISCNSVDKPKKPNNLISEAQMSELLYDVYVVNAAKGINRKLLEKNGIVPETYILEKHNIDSLQFAESNLYYSFNTEVYKGIIEKIKKRIETEKEAYEAIRNIENKKDKRNSDSIKQKARRHKDSIKRVIDSVGFKGLNS
ncbi:DUF4296 domain-containing protein [Winogradskyella eckloniae]|uniref:DUF4296 domain-containing protein n=1 Tax=Winogradskyella eckloniae TaxID=1089306 RepID=UPI001564189E|nr:DUF4296 domain-containing protein [Winogradskyella eckloniae]NRD19149.1 DUF4296 domain-containing protein [Winogradskyella eckloniae]